MKDIIDKAKCGDQLAMEQIASAYKGLVRSLANKFFLVGGDKDDLLQEGMLGLFYAVMYYDEEKGSFPSFVELCVLRQLLDAVKKDNGVKNKPLSNYVDIAVTENLSDGSNPLENILEREYADRIKKVIDGNLTAIEKRVLELFIDGFSYEDIAKKTNKSYKAVDGALQRARKKLLAAKE
ncbi:MAG: sigma-70 family RNA polymerase sigma factor [Corallococcus sp.]|nr:sigma-70 family RNA polymerase sigma factor [Bacillota bacterium]MCM1533832.1 sigma-70 family RNA polymerase sigma factor [Corallococcus sp.]